MSIARRVTATSSASESVGFCATVTRNPSAVSRAWTFCHPEPSTNPPWTRTTFLTGPDIDRSFQGPTCDEATVWSAGLPQVRNKCAGWRGHARGLSWAGVLLTQPRQRAMLALLLATRGSVPVSEMIDAFWPREAAASVLNQIHRHIGALRRLCEPELGRRQAGRYIPSAGNGYRIHVTADSLDIRQFRATIAEAERLDP